MKTLPLSLILCVYLITKACSSIGHIKIKKDTFKGATVGTVQLEHESVEGTDFFNRSTMAGVTYAVEWQGNGFSTFRINITCWDGELSGGLLYDKVFVKTDSDTFKFTARDRQGGSIKLESTTGDYVTYRASATVDLDPRLAQKILESSTLVFRLYYQAKPLTFKLEPGDLLNLQELIKKVQRAS